LFLSHLPCHAVFTAWTCAYTVYYILTVFIGNDFDKFGISKLRDDKYIIYSARSTTHVTRWFITTSLFPSESAVPASSSNDNNNHIVDIVVVVADLAHVLAGLFCTEETGEADLLLGVTPS
jgi:hypothetical protein